MAKAGIRRSQAPNLCHAEAKIGPEQDISLPRCRRLTSRRSSRTVAPKSSQSPGTVFTQLGPDPVAEAAGCGGIATPGVCLLAACGYKIRRTHQEICQ